MTSPKEPDPLARLLGHAVVGSLALYLFGRRSGGAGLLAAMLTIIAHEAFDAPVAQKLSEFGI